MNLGLKEEICTAPEGQTGEAWESSKQSSQLHKGQHLTE